MAAVFGLLLTSVVLSTELGSARGQAHAVDTCSHSDQTYTMGYGDASGEITARYGMVWTDLALYASHVQPNLLYPDEVICIPTGTPDNTTYAASARSLPAGDVLASLVRARAVDPVTYESAQPVNSMQVATLSARQSMWPLIGRANLFPYGQCTWYANERYHRLYGVYVPWQTHANAWQWRARAAEFGWRISLRPSFGSIMVLQPSVQGASRIGHVGVVERVNRDGSFTASSMNWGARRAAVTWSTFFPGPGVSFISR